MGKRIHADGACPCDYLIVGERPGREEWQRGLNFIGPAGQELWSRIDRVLGMERDDFRVCNLVPTFSVKPPTPEEITEWLPLLRAEIQKCQPKLILTVGYHAARALLPQFANVNGDFFHGLTYRYSYGTLRPRQALVVPIVHASAALRQPDLYQNQFTEDIRAAGRVMRLLDRGESVPVHVTKVPRPYRCGLAGFGKEGLTLGLDTEGTKHLAECITIAKGMQDACLIEDPADKRFLWAAIAHAKALVIHHAKFDLQSLVGTNSDARIPRIIHDTMLQAYLLGLPQSLKVLAYRELGFEMAEYEDLVTPIDNAQVRAVLRSVYEEETARQRVQREQVERDKKAAKAAAADRRRAGRRADRQKAEAARSTGRRSGTDPGRRDRGTASCRRATTAGDADSPAVRDPADAEAEGPSSSAPSTDLGIPRRALTTLHGLLTKDTEQTVRRRWLHSTFAPHITLPPPATWKSAPDNERTQYALTDAVAHLQVHERLYPQLISRGLKAIYDIDRGVLPMIVRMEQVGMACDADILHGLTKEFDAEYEQVCEQLERLVGHPVNPDSGEQVSDVLFTELGITPTRRTKSGKHHTTDAKYLKARKREHKAVGLILDGRQLTKFKGTYTEKLPGMLVDGRYHADWKYTRTKTGRLAEEIILLIPKHSERGKRIRNAFHANKGNRLVACDLSQIEMRVMTDESQDRVLLDIYRRGADVHANVAHELLGAPKRKEDQDDSLHRLPAKTFNFGIINGMTEYGMLDQLHEAGQLHWTIDEVQDFRKEWFVLHKGVRQYWDNQIKFARARGYVQDRFGRRSYITKIWSEDERIVSGAERETLMPIQAGADAISKIWNRRLWAYCIQPRQRRGEYCEPWVRVHDATVLEVQRRYARDVQQQMLAMVPDLLSVPTTADGNSGERWGELKG